MMLMWRRLLHPSPDLSEPSVGADRAWYPGITAFERVQEMGLVDLLYKESLKTTNKWRYMRENTDLGAPHGHPESRRTPAGRGGKACISLEAEHGHPGATKLTLRMLRRWWEASQFSEKKIHVQDLLLYTGFWLFSLTDLGIELSNSQPLPWFFFFFSFPLCFWHVSPAGVGLVKPFSCPVGLAYLDSAPAWTSQWKPWFNVEKWSQTQIHPLSWALSPLPSLVQSFIY